MPLTMDEFVALNNEVRDEMIDKKQELCLSCMACCHVLLIPLPKLGKRSFERTFYSVKAIEFWNVRGCKPWMDDDGNEWMVLDFPCPQIGPKGCGIYGTRPYYCRTQSGMNNPWTRKVCKWRELEGSR